MTGYSDRIWDLAALAADGVRDLVDACTAHGPQPITRGGETVAVMISMKDWATIRELLKAQIVEGDLGADGRDDCPSAEIVHFHRSSEDEDQS